MTHNLDEQRRVWDRSFHERDRQLMSLFLNIVYVFQTIFKSRHNYKLLLMQKLVVPLPMFQKACFSAIQNNSKEMKVKPLFAILFSC